MKQLIGVLVFAVVAIAQSEAFAKDPVYPEITAVAERWLGLLDQERYEQAWQETSNYYRAVVTREDFLRITEGTRQPLGKTVSRAFWKEYYSKTWKGMPDGNYCYTTFNTIFENRPGGGFEHVLLQMHNREWKVTGHNLR